MNAAKTSQDLIALYRRHVEIATRRAASALEKTGFDAVVLHAGRIQHRSPFDDMDWPFVPVPMFTYYTPLRWPDSAVVVTKTGAVLWAVEASGFWERPAAPDWSLIRAGLQTNVVPGLDRVKGSLPQGKIAFIGHERAAAADLGIAADDVNPGPLVEALEDARVEKTPYEIEVMAAASRRAARGHRAAAEAFMANERSELRIHLAYLRASDQDDAETPYKGIVALGEDAAVLHHNIYVDRPRAGSLLIDAGARYNGYASDITRTYVDDRAGDAEAFRALVEGLDRLQQATIEDITIGLNYESLHDGCHLKLGALMAETGLVTCSAEAAAEQGITRAFFPHGLGHSLGVQVHDVSCRKREPKPENPFLRHTAAITAGQVFTIEPGLYFIDALLADLKAKPAGDSVRWSAVETLQPFGGIRIEDNVYVRPEGGTRNLTREAFAAA